MLLHTASFYTARVYAKKLFFTQQACTHSNLLHSKSLQREASKWPFNAYFSPLGASFLQNLASKGKKVGIEGCRPPDCLEPLVKRESCYGFFTAFFQQNVEKYGFATSRLVWELLRFFRSFFSKTLKRYGLITVLLQVGLQIIAMFFWFDPFFGHYG